jgi:type IX secretion system PorP/SprF family membrane protein
MKKILLQILLYIGVCVNAQVMSYDFYSYKQNNMFNVNPAYMTKNNGINMIVDAQSQNTGVAYSNKNIMAGVYSIVGKQQAIGGKIISDTRGAFQLLKADISYAYKAKFTEDHSLTLGLSAGILNNSLLVSRIENYEALDKTDPTLTKSYFNTTQFSVGAGLFYNYKNLDVSISLPNMVVTNQNINGYFHSAVFYTIKAGSKFKIEPWVSYQHIPVTKSLGALFVRAVYRDLIWVQAGYQTNNNFCAALGVSIENITISYGYNTSNNQFSTIASGRQEVTLGYRIIPKSQKAKTTQQENSLTTILAKLDELSKADITDANRDDIKKQLQLLKQQLQTAEMDNSTPEKAETVNKQLLQIDEKLKLIEQKLQK